MSGAMDGNKDGRYRWICFSRVEVSALMAGITSSKVIIRSSHVEGRVWPSETTINKDGRVCAEKGFCNRLLWLSSYSMAPESGPPD